MHFRMEMNRPTSSLSKSVHLLRAYLSTHSEALMMTMKNSTEKNESNQENKRDVKMVDEGNKENVLLNVQIDSKTK